MVVLGGGGAVFNERGTPVGVLPGGLAGRHTAAHGTGQGVMAEVP